VTRLTQPLVCADDHDAAPGQRSCVRRRHSIVSNRAWRMMEIACSIA